MARDVACKNKADRGPAFSDRTSYPDLLLPGLAGPATRVLRPTSVGRINLQLVWIGWYAQTQLSVVNVLSFLSALRTDFRWDNFLMRR